MESITMSVEEADKLETIYVEGDDLAFVQFIKENWDYARLAAVGGKFRWMLFNDDGSKCVVRPISAKPHAD